MWRKSSFCNGAAACVELRWIKALTCNNGSCVAVAYRKSSASSGNGECVEAGLCSCGDADQVWVRDSKHPDGNVLRFATGSWWSFIAAIKTGQLPIYDGPIRLEQHDTGPWLMWDEAEPAVALVFDEAEVDAFVEGVRAKEFDPDVLASDVMASALKAPSGRPAPPLAGFGVESAPV